MKLRRRTFLHLAAGAAALSTASRHAWARALASVPHQTGQVSSGDASIFYRSFGAKGRTPIVVMHGANYFDSYDWIGVAGVLASDREVVAFDRPSATGR